MLARLLTLFMVQFLCSNFGLSQRWDGNVLYDLENNDAAFTAQASLWTVSSLKDSNKRVERCAGNDLLGGYNIMGGNANQYLQRTYTGLPDHNQILLIFTIYTLDSWDEPENDHFNVKIADTEIVGWAVDYKVNIVTPLCGNPAFDDLPPYQINYQIAHQGPSVTITITIMTNEGSENESLGIRDVILTFTTVDSPSQKFCAASTDLTLPSNYITCSCSDSQYTFPANSGTCHDCNSICQTCDGPSAHNCLTCSVQDFYVDKTCINYCNEPFSSQVVGANTLCQTPCPGQFAWKGASCTDTCSSPYSSVIVESLKACVCFNEVAAGQDCYACDPSCETCNGQEATQCLSCFDRFYLVVNGIDKTCEPCDSSCLTCDGPGDHQCLSCDPGFFLIDGECSSCDPSCLTCDGPSTNECLTCHSHFYLLPTQNSCNSCDDSCLECTGPSENQCKTCDSHNYLYKNTTCITACNSPFFITQDATNQYCDTSCPYSYAMNDGRCSSICDGLAVRDEFYTLKACYCNSPNYRYWNDSCLSNCLFPLKSRTSNSLNYCDFPCASNEYLYFNQSCSPSCPLPYVPYGVANNLYCGDLGCKSMKIDLFKETVTGFQYNLKLSPKKCDLPADYMRDMLNSNADAKEYLHDFSFAVARTAPATYFLDLTLGASILQDTTLRINFTGLSGNVVVFSKLNGGSLAQKLAAIGAAAGSAVNFGTVTSLVSIIVLKSTASVWGFVGFQQLLTYFKYINVVYPFQIQMFFKLGGATQFGNLPNLIDTLTNSSYTTLLSNEKLLHTQIAPKKFQSQNDTSIFIKQGGSLILLNILLLTLVIIFSLIRVQTKIGKSKIITAVESTLRWAFTLRSFLTGSLPFIVSIFLQIRTINFENEYLALSSSLAIAALVYFGAMTFFIFFLVYSIPAEKFKEEKIKKVYGTLVVNPEIKSSHAKYYYLMVLFRSVLFAALIVFVESNPLAQILPLVIFNVLFAFYIYKKVRFEHPKETRKTILTETLLVPIGILVSLLIVKRQSENYYQTIGWIVTALIAIIFVNEIIFIIHVQIETMQKLWQKIQAFLIERKMKKNMEYLKDQIDSPESQLKTNSTLKTENSPMLKSRKHKKRPLSFQSQINLPTQNKEIAQPLTTRYIKKLSEIPEPSEPEDLISPQEESSASPQVQPDWHPSFSNYLTNPSEDLPQQEKKKINSSIQELEQIIIQQTASEVCDFASEDLEENSDFSPMHKIR